MKRTFLISSVAALAIVAVASYSAFAHGPQNGQRMGGGMMGMMMGGGYGHMSQYSQIKPLTTDELKTKLKLTDEQIPAWTAYINTLKTTEENFETQHESMDPQTMHEMSFEDRQNYMKSMWDAHSEDAKALETAEAALLKVLTAEQAEIFKSTPTFAGMPCGGNYGGGYMMNSAPHMSE